MKYMHIFFLCVGLFILGVNVSLAKGADMAIHNGSAISFDYTLTVDGKVFDTSKGKEPLKYTQGKGEIIPGLERQLEGLHTGDEKTIVISPAEGYGEVDPKAFKEVPRSSMPANTDLAVGMILQAKTTDGRMIPLRIAEIKKDTVLLDSNHPLAGKTLTFQVKVVSVQ